MKLFQNSGQFGDLKSMEVKINDKDVTDSVLSVYIYQDVFAPTNTANIIVNDTANLLQTVPIRAGTKVEIEFETEHGSENDGKSKWEMVVYRVGDKDVTNSKAQTYTVYCAHVSFINNQTKKIQKAFKDKKADQVVKEIAGQLGGGGVITEETSENISLVIPNWTPFYAVGWITKFSMKDKAADYLFFQDFENNWIFKPFETLFESDEESCGVTFKIMPTSVGGREKKIEDYTMIISKYHFEHYDALNNMASGFYKSKLLTYDFIEKKFETEVFNFGQDCKKDAERLEVDEAAIMASEDSNISFLPKHEGLFDSGVSYLDSSKDWSGSRKSSIMKFEQDKMVAQMPGSAKSREWFGKNCEIDLPDQIGENDEEFDERRRGRYLITSIAHMLTGGTYMVNIEFTKKRLEKK